MCQVYDEASRDRVPTKAQPQKISYITAWEQNRLSKLSLSFPLTDNSRNEKKTEEFVCCFALSSTTM